MFRVFAFLFSIFGPAAFTLDDAWSPFCHAACAELKLGSPSAGHSATSGEFDPDVPVCSTDVSAVGSLLVEDARLPTAGSAPFSQVRSRSERSGASRSVLASAKAPGSLRTYGASFCAAVLSRGGRGAVFSCFAILLVASSLTDSGPVGR